MPKPTAAQLKAAAAADRSAKCAGCTHSPAYHDGDGGRPCRAWAPDESPDQTTDNFCKCKGWQDQAS